MVKSFAGGKMGPDYAPFSAILSLVQIANIIDFPDYAPCSAILSVVQIKNIIDFRGVF
jgi:hypothetical protein